MKINILALLLTVFHFTAFAEPFFRGPQSSSMGHAGRAGIDSAESAFINPALLPLMKASGFNMYYRDGYIEDGQHRNSMGIGFFDNSEGVYFPGSLHYMRLRDTGFGAGRPADGEVWHGAMGYKVSDRFLVGANAYRLTYKVDGTSYEQWNGSFGTLVRVNPDFGVAYVLENVAQPGGDVPMGLREDMVQSVGLFGAIADIAHLRFDVSRREKHNPDHKLTYMAGMETQSHKFFLLRMGFKRDELLEQKLWTAGFCFNGPRLKIDYAFEKSEDRASGALHSVDLRLPF